MNNILDCYCLDVKHWTMYCREISEVMIDSEDVKLEKRYYDENFIWSSRNGKQRNFFLKRPSSQIILKTEKWMCLLESRPHNIQAAIISDWFYCPGFSLNNTLELNVICETLMQY